MGRALTLAAVLVFFVVSFSAMQEVIPCPGANDQQFIVLGCYSWDPGSSIRDDALLINSTFLYDEQEACQDLKVKTGQFLNKIEGGFVEGVRIENGNQFYVDALGLFDNSGNPTGLWVSGSITVLSGSDLVQALFDISQHEGAHALEVTPGS